MDKLIKKKISMVVYLDRVICLRSDVQARIDK
jgi:hypothetical protein